MPVFDAPVTGRFCWIELQTRDVAAAKQFYGSLFGWSYEDLVVPQGSYAMGKIGGKTGGKLVTGVVALPAPEQPPSWVSYVAVDDVQVSTDAAARLGAKVLLPPTTFGTGTLSALADPTGGTFMLWHTTQPMGAFCYGEPGALTWNELVSSNADVAQRFYTQLFGWQAEAMPMPGTSYTVLKHGQTAVGGLMQQPLDLAGAPSMWTAYFAVEDADATFASAVKLGAQVIVPVTDLPEVGRFGWLQDPQGAVFAIIKSAVPA
jgi:uncharacterized protein